MNICSYAYADTSYIKYMDKSLEWYTTVWRSAFPLVALSDINKLALSALHWVSSQWNLQRQLGAVVTSKYGSLSQ